MEYWLMSEDKKEKLQLPVPPETYEVEREQNNTTVNIINLGELNLLGKGKLATLPIESFFPAHEYPFCQYTGFPKPYECVAMIDKWRKSIRPIRVLITEADVNIAMSIEKFSHKEQDGTGDVYFTLELKEYKYESSSSVSSLSAQTSGTKKTAKPAATRQTKAVAKTYIVKKGDTLWTIQKGRLGAVQIIKA